MAFDSSATLKDMLAAAEGVIGAGWPKIRACADRALREQEDALKEICALRVQGDIDEDEMRSEIEDEKKTFAAALLACEVKAKATAQRAANAAFAVLEKAIRACL